MTPTIDRDESALCNSVRWVARWVSLSRGGGVSGVVNLSKFSLSLSVSPISSSFFPSFFTFSLISFGFAVLDCCVFFFFFFSFFFFFTFLFKDFHGLLTGLAGCGS